MGRDDLSLLLSLLVFWRWFGSVVQLEELEVIVAAIREGDSEEVKVAPSPRGRRRLLISSVNGPMMC